MRLQNKLSVFLLFGYVSTLALLQSCTTEPGSPKTIVLQPDGVTGQDVWITSVYSYNSDYGVDDDKLQVGGYGDLYYGLIRFDLTGLPKQATSATIVLQPYNRGDNSTPVSMTLHQVTSDWNESAGWNNRPIAGTSIATLPAPIAGIPDSIDVTSLYNSWQAGTSTNFGIELQPTGNNNQFDVFHSSDYVADPTLRPKLVIVP